MNTDIITSNTDDINTNLYMPNTSNYMVSVIDDEVVNLDDIVNTEKPQMLEVVSKNFQGKQLIID